jgi:FdrA protein
METAKKAARNLEIVIVLVGTEEDPQDLSSQVERFEGVGAQVETSISDACAYIGRRLGATDNLREFPEIDHSILKKPIKAINVGLESFAASLTGQKAEVIHVAWRPPAGGNEKLISILNRMKNR